MKIKERGSDKLRILDRFIGIPVVSALALMRQKNHSSSNVTSIGIIALGAIGDVLLSVGPAIPQLRIAFPGAAICLFTSKSNRGIVPLLPPCDVVEVIPITNLVKSISIIRACKHDLLIDFGPWPRISAVLSALSKARFTVGFKTRGQYRHFAYDLAVEHQATVHEFENHASLLAAIGVGRPAPPSVTPSEEARKHLLETHQQPYIICHPWASGFRGDLREWPEEQWRNLAAALVGYGWNVIFTGGPEDVDRSQMLTEGFALDGKVINVAGHYNLEETAALLGGSAAVVTVNTGIMHLAAALELPIVALHGPTNPRRWGPLSKQARIIIPNSPDVGYLNLGFEYPHDAISRMHLIGIKEVLDAVLAIAKSPPAATFRG